MRRLRLAADIVLCLLFAGTTAILVARFEKLRGEQTVFEKLAGEVEEVRTREYSFTDHETRLKSTAEAKQILPEYNLLYQENTDLAGWVKIEGTRINYPVMSTPEEPEFYLHRDFYRQESYSGTPFIGQDYQAENLILMLFGHHMRNGTMFSDLMKYRDNSFWDNHRTIQFDTLYEKRKYEIFAVGYAPSASEAEQYMRFYSFTGSSGYQEYIRFLKEEALYETGIWPERAPLLLLITCSYAAGWDCQWRYLQENGQPVQGWQQLEWQGDLDWYYFDPNGFMQRGWQLIGEKWYYFYESGQMADGEVEVGGRKVQFEQGVLIDLPNDEAHRKASYARDERTEAEILQAEEKIRQAVEYCNQGETPYEKAYRICEWMKEHLYYDLNGPYDVVGALNAGGTICEGYAVVYREIADRMGFYCEKIVSRKMNHAWNFIVVDGMEYYTDVTWEDGGNQLFNMLLGEEIERTHTIEAVQHQSQF